jgi:hypothetical protein
MKKNVVVIIIVAIILILIGVAVYFFVKGSKKGKNLDKDGNIIDPSKDKDGKLLPLEKIPEVTPPPNYTTPPPNYTTPTTLLPCTKDAFPMGMKAKNQCVQRLQQKLKLDDDGKFGKNTNTAVVGLGFVVPLTEADYDKIIAGLPPTAAAPASTTTTTTNTDYEKIIRKIGTGSATKRYYNPNYVRVKYDAGTFENELNFKFYENSQPNAIPDVNFMVYDAVRLKTIAIGKWFSNGNIRIFEKNIKNGKLVEDKNSYYLVEGSNVWDNLKLLEPLLKNPFISFNF